MLIDADLYRDARFPDGKEDTCRVTLMKIADAAIEAGLTVRRD